MAAFLSPSHACHFEIDSSTDTPAHEPKNVHQNYILLPHSLTFAVFSHDRQKRGKEKFFHGCLFGIRFILAPVNEPISELGLELYKAHRGTL